MENSIEKLTNLQKEFGYKEGEINSVALLGLFGEAGEVMDECSFVTDGNADAEFYKNDYHYYSPIELKLKAINIAKYIDYLKKLIRSKKAPQFEIKIENEENFDKEICDVLYYLNVLAINRGKTLNDYAEISYQKVMSKKKQ